MSRPRLLDLFLGGGVRRRLLWLAGGLGALYLAVQWTANRLFMPPGFGR